MPKTLREALGITEANKVRIGFKDLAGYQNALDAMKQPTKVVATANKTTVGSASTNASTEVNLSGVVENGFISDASLKQMWLSLEVFGGVPVQKENEISIAAPVNTINNPIWSGGKLNTKFQVCPTTAVGSSIPDDLYVGVIFNIAVKGKEYLEHFYPSDSMTAENEGNNMPNLMEYMLKGQLWAEIVVPNGNDAATGYVFNAKVIGSQDVDENTIYVSSPICFLDLFQKVFPKTTVNDEDEYAGVYTSGYNAYDAKISGMTGSDLSSKISSSSSKEVKTLQVVPACTNGCRVRLWVDRDAMVNGVPKEMQGRNYINTPMNAVSTSSDGVPVLSGETNPTSHVDVYIDPGHTARTDVGGDSAREALQEFKINGKIVWDMGGKYKEIADNLGFTSTTQDALEHVLNVKYAHALRACCEKINVNAGVFDWEDQNPHTERTKILGESLQKIRPKIFISMHFNAKGYADDAPAEVKRRIKQNAYQLKNDAVGTRIYTHLSNNKWKDFAEKTVNAIHHVRTQRGGGDGSITTPAAGENYGVLQRAKGAGVQSAFLVEMGFYDNVDDLLWCSKHENIYAICQAMAEVIKGELPPASS